MKPSAADMMVGLVVNDERATLFRTPDGRAFASVRVGEHRETHALESTRFRRWLAGEFWAAFRRAPSPDAVRQALGPLVHLAHESPEVHDVHVRLAPYGEGLVLDLGDDAHRAVVVDRTGWRIVDESPVHFLRTPGMLPLAVPEDGGSLKLLRKHVTFKEDSDFALFTGWLLSSLCPHGPYIIMVLLGEQGSLKSTTARKARRLLDPNRADLRTPPKESRDLAIAAENARVVGFDNLSRLSDTLSDDLCRLATGSGFAVRKLYSDSEESIFAASRPVVLNGIDGFATKGDLLDRAVVVTLTRPAAYLPEAEVWAAFDAATPKILGALLDAVVAAIQNVSRTTVPGDLRMADSARWVQAAEPVCPWPAGTWVRAIQGVRAASHREVVDSSAIGPALEALLEARFLPDTPWTGTASELLAELGERVPDRVKNMREWPKSGRGLSVELRRIAAALRGLGYGIRLPEELPREAKRRTFELWRDKPGPEERGEDRHNRHNRHGSDGNAGNTASFGRSSDDGSPRDVTVDDGLPGGLDAFERTQEEPPW